MLEIKYKKHKFPAYRYDVAINEVVNIERNNRILKPTEIKGNFYLSLLNSMGKKIQVNVKHIAREYANRFVQLQLLNLVSVNTYDTPITSEINVAQDDRVELDKVIDAFEESGKFTSSQRKKVLDMMGLPEHSIWISDIDTLLDAQTLLDNMCHDQLIQMEERAIYTMERYGVENTRTAIPNVMVQITARMALAKEEAMKYDYLKEYNFMTIDELRRTVNIFCCADFEYYLVEKWRRDLRERFFFHIAYKSNGITLCGYDSIIIPMNTLEDIQSAFKLLTELYGWKEQR